MTFAALLLLASQTSTPDAAKLELDQVIARTTAVSDQAFDCMEKQSKVQLKQQIEEGSAEIIVDSALASCKNYKTLYVQSATSLYITPTKAQELADDAFWKIREAYVIQVQKWMDEPVVAELRTQVVISHWRKCVTDKARDWSRLRDEARTVSSAAVTACANFEPKVRSAFASELRIKKLPSSGASDIIATVGGKMQEVAVEAVISERAKQLPKRTR